MSFGQSANLYNQIRQDYNQEVIDKVVELVGKEKDKELLDIGCGTGIATRQLAEYGFKLTATDIDADMIDHAKLESNRENYFVMRADDLAFQDNQFKGITAFGAFHWFDDKKSVGEIKRVLQPQGSFVVVNKKDISDFRKQIVDIIESHTGSKLDESKQNYDPKTTLVQNSFTDIQENIIYSTEYFSPEAAMAHAKTMRMWEKIPELDQPEIEHKLREFISAHLDENMQYPRQLATVIVSGIKPL